MIKEELRSPELSWQDELLNYLNEFLGRTSRDLSTELGKKMVFRTEPLFYQSNRAEICRLKAGLSETGEPINDGVLVKFFKLGYDYKKFLAEVALYEKLEGVPLVKPIAVIANPEQPIIVYRFYPAGDLIKQYGELGRTPNLGEFISIVRTLGRALSAMHALGVAHRDIKGSNVLATDVTSFEEVELTDVDHCSEMIQYDPGIARSGTFQFMPPEAISLEAITFGHQYDYFLADQYALAVLLYELLSEWDLPFGDLHEKLAVASRESDLMALVDAASTFSQACTEGSIAYLPLSQNEKARQVMTEAQLIELDKVFQKALSVKANDRYHDDTNREDTKLAIQAFIDDLLKVLERDWPNSDLVEDEPNEPPSSGGNQSRVGRLFRNIFGG